MIQAGYSPAFFRARFNRYLRMGHDIIGYLCAMETRVIHSASSIPAYANLLRVLLDDFFIKKAKDFVS